MQRGGWIRCRTTSYKLSTLFLLLMGKECNCNVVLHVTELVEVTSNRVGLTLSQNGTAVCTAVVLR